MTKTLLVAAAIVTIATTAALAGWKPRISLSDNDGYPLGWVYIPTAGLDDCDNAFTRWVIEAARVEAHSRPNKKAPVVAVFRGGGGCTIFFRNRVAKWDFMVLDCSIVLDGDGSLSTKQNYDSFL
jgi:hypothetical protein